MTKTLQTATLQRVRRNRLRKHIWNRLRRQQESTTANSTLNEQVTTEQLVSKEGQRTQTLLPSSARKPIDPNLPIQPILTFHHQSKRNWKGESVLERVYRAGLNPRFKGVLVRHITDKIQDSFKAFVSCLKNDYALHNLVRIQIDHSSLVRSILVPLQALKNLDENQIMGNVMRTLQSNESLALDKKFRMNVGIVDMPAGSGSALYINQVREARITKRSIYAINNSDNLCFPRAIAVGQAYLRGKKDFIKMKRKRLQKAEALRILNVARVSAPVSIQDIKHFEAKLGINIVVFSARSGNKVLYSKVQKWRKTVYLWLIELDGMNHFDLVLKPNAFLAKKKFCHHCLKGYDKGHKCKHSCFCGLKKCTLRQKLLCKECNRVCRSNECFQSHKKLRKKHNKTYPSTCSKSYICINCKQDCQRSTTHMCGYWQCSTCKIFVQGKHKCYLIGQLPKRVSSKYIDFDFETDQSSGTHVPNFAVAYKSCPDCIDVPTSEQPFCTNCGDRDIVFEGYDVVTQFGKWLFSSDHKYYTARSHNGAGFDNSFLLEYLLSESIMPELIYNGTKLLYMYIQRGLNIRVVDTMKFLPMPLLQLPNAFGLEGTAKGFFPHYFNTEENQSYIGPMPSPAMYGYNEMKPSTRSQFLIWYETVKEETFDFRQEMERYCRSDVDILQRACNQFRRLIINLTEESVLDDSGKLQSIAVDPFQYITIASVCMAIFQYKFLADQYNILKDNAWITAARRGAKFYIDDEEVGNVLNLKYTFQSSPIARISEYFDTHSKSSIEWLEFLKVKNKVHIVHALNGGEMTWKSYRFDGFDAFSNTVYEFHGCLFHGCPICYPHSAEQVRHPHTGQSMQELYRLTVNREHELKQHGFNLITIWEHEFHTLKTTPEFVSFIETFTAIERLIPRESFYGGRTSVNTVYYKIDDTIGEKIKYVDFTSLYPYVNKNCAYPVGHPTIITKHFPPIEKCFGLVKADILPPTNLFHPILPLRCNNKNMFVLCRTCAELNNVDCRCTDSQRMLTGTWDTMHVIKAKQLGYEIKKIHEIYHWEERSTDIFRGYIDAFYRHKAEASDYPANVVTDEEKHNYIRDIEAHEGIQLSPSNIKHNPGLRSVCKLALNSLWGKFAQNLNYNKTKMLSQPEELVKLLIDQRHRINDFNVINEELLQVSYKHCDEFVPENGKTNIYVAIFTTAYARLKLYDILESLGERALYCDTDSVIYVSRNDEPDVTVGNYLGDLTNELENDDYIVEFCAAAPKQYAYRTVKGQITCKAKGFSMDYNTSKVLNFVSLRDMVLSGKTLNIERKNIRRDKINVKVVNRVESKACRMVMNKRWRSENTTFPYGYRVPIDS